MQRLSSGQRINRAADDAAGLSLSDRMTTNIRGLNMAVRKVVVGYKGSAEATFAVGGKSRLMFVQGKRGVPPRASAGLCCLGGMLDGLCGYLSVGEL